MLPARRYPGRWSRRGSPFGWCRTPLSARRSRSCCMSCCPP